MFHILDGEKLAQKFIQYLQNEVKNLPAKPHLLVLMVGKNRASQIFVRKKGKICRMLGINFSLKIIRAPFSTKRVCQILGLAIKQKKPHGVVVQLPLPKGVNTDQVLKCIPKEMDVEGFNNHAIVSPVALGIVTLLTEYKITIKGRKIAVVGAGKLVGRPTARLMKRLGAKVKIYDQDVKNLAGHLREADIIISGVGKPHLIQGTMIKRGAVVVDAGTSLQAGKILGDVDVTSAREKASFFAPVPGGVGPMTVVMLLMNLVELVKKIK